MFIDEFPRIDKSIVTQTIIPMLATRKDPTAPIQITDDKNQLILASTATWQFNWAYKSYLEYRKEIMENNPLYSLHEFDVDDLGDFMAKSVVEYSKKHSPRVIFLMEYKLLWPKDSHGWFPASLIEKTKASFLTEATGKDKKGKDKGTYVLGIDPARESDLFAVSVLKLSSNGNKLVNIITMKKPTFPEMANKIRELTRLYNVSRIAIDYGGGGLAVRDQLAEHSLYYDDEEDTFKEQELILPIDISQFPEKSGNRILDIVYFSPKEIHQMNVDLKSDMEHGRVLLPRSPITGDEESEEIFVEMKKLEEELMAITASVRPSGVLHFDTPSKRMIKDRYTSLLLANKAAKDLRQQGEKQETQELASGFWA